MPSRRQNERRAQVAHEANLAICQQHRNMSTTPRPPNDPEGDFLKSEEKRLARLARGCEKCMNRKKDCKQCRKKMNMWNKCKKATKASESAETFAKEAEEVVAAMLLDHEFGKNTFVYRHHHDMSTARLLARMDSLISAVRNSSLSDPFSHVPTPVFEQEK